MDMISYQMGKNSAPQPSGSLSITENGTYDVTEKASAVVNVPQGITPLDYTVQCSAESQIVEKLTVKSGMKIPSPLYTPTSGSFFGWKDDNDVIIDFTNGYEINRNQTITANIGSTFMDLIYGAYSVYGYTKESHPYFIFHTVIGSSNSYIAFFSGTPTVTDTNISMPNCSFDSWFSYSFQNYDTAFVTSIIVQQAREMRSWWSLESCSPNENSHIYANFDISQLTLGTKHNLNAQST